MKVVEVPCGNLLAGPLAGQGPWPLNLRAILCDLRPRFLKKACAGPGWRRVSRNGRVLWCSDRAPEENTRQPVAVRLQTWHRPILPAERPQAYGLLLCTRVLADAASSQDDALFRTRLVAANAFAGELAVDLGGELVLEFQRAST